MARTGRRGVVGLLAALALAPVLATPALAASTLDPARVPAGTYGLDKQHASLLARVRHMGFSKYTMRFDRFDAHFDYDPKDPAAAKLQVTVDVGSLDVGDPEIGPRFAKQFLDAEAHPTATFVSTGLTQVDATHGVLAGDLTLRGVTRPVQLNVVFDGYGSTLLAGQRAGFSATGRISRADFGSSFLAPDIVADEVDLVIEAEFVKK